MNTSRSEIVPDNPFSPLTDSSFFYNRELSWLDFNRRVLEEAIDDRNPLLEKCKFAAIYASNLDEFFMIRVSRLFDHVAAGFNLPDNKSGLTPSEQLLAISEKTHQLMKTHDDIFLQHLTPLLEKEGVKFVRMVELTDGENLSYLKARKRGATVRLEIHSTSYNQKVVDYLVEELEMMNKEVYFIRGPLDLTYLFSLYKTLTESHHHLMYEPYTPQIPAELIGKNDIFEAALKQDLFFHHPYDSFQTIVDFISQAADDPDVIAIKQTLYRVSGDSPIMKALERAAENGKEVTVLVELKARFDEQNNVEWAKELENAGCHVIYGINHLKTHSKIALVVRQKKDHIERFVHLGTGNYNDSTAKTYSDMGLITSDEKFGIDATNYFNYLSGHMAKPEYHHLIVSPSDIRDEYVELVDKEISYHQEFGDGHIIAKMNSLTDKKLIMKFYEASMAGVKVDLIIRGICCLKPGIEGFSENIKVRSIVGRFLEHTRIYYFHHHGQQKVYLSSADLMTRNMDRRIEILFPIFSNPIKEKITQCLDTILNDNVKARELNSNGHYHYVKRQQNEAEINSQHIFCEQAYQQSKNVEKPKAVKTSSIKTLLLKIFKR